MANWCSRLVCKFEKPIHGLKCPRNVYRNFTVLLCETLYFGAFGVYLIILSPDSPKYGSNSHAKWGWIIDRYIKINV